MSLKLKELSQLNASLWEKVHTLEFKLLEQLDGRKRDKKTFAKNLVRLSKYLSDQNYQPSQVKQMLSKESVGVQKEIESDRSESFVDDHPIEEENKAINDLEEANNEKTGEES